MNISFYSDKNHLFPLLSDDGKTVMLRESVEINAFYANFDHYMKMFGNGDSTKIEPNAVPINPTKILCPAVNFKSHSSETKTKSPESPYFFTKFNDSITGYKDPILLRKSVTELDYEGEIAAIIGKKTKDASIKNALESIVALAVVNDVSARNLQENITPGLGKNWILGKAQESFLPVSAWVHKWDGSDVEIVTTVNGEKRQYGKISEMIFSFPEMISYLSKHITLSPGDIILSGTPKGVAKSGKFPYLKNGDKVKVSSSRIGYIENTVKSVDY